MLILSNNLLSKTKLNCPEDAIIRINIAWVKSQKELEEIILSIDRHIYLDYPFGRTKPPRPKIKLEAALKLASKYAHIKYFALSNVEDPEWIAQIRKALPEQIDLVPKIETQKGVQNLEKIIKKAGIKHIMLDKEDLYIDVKADQKKYEQMVRAVRQKAKKLGIKLLELHGVVFGLQT